MAISSTLVSLGILVGIYSLLALGLNVKYGYTGLIEIGHVAFFLIGAHVTALLMLPPAEERAFVEYVLGLGWPWLPSVAVATVIAGVVGGLVALPAIRLREDYLAIVVLGLSIILQFVVRNEAWLANGTDGLYGINRPLGAFFPLEATLGAEGAAILGVTVGVVYAAAACLTARLNASAEPRRATNTALYATTLGAGAFARRFGVRAGGLAGLLVGGVAAVGAYLGVPYVLLVLLGGASVFTWSFAGAVLAHHYSGLSRGDAATGVALAVALILSLLPLVFLDAVTGSVGAVLALGALAYAVRRLAFSWEEVGWSEAGFVRVLGVAAVSVFALRYFVVEALRIGGRDGTNAAATETMENLLWLLRFDVSGFGGFVSAGGVALDYPRFLLVLTAVVVAGAYYATERMTESPFGRVLRAIREDEDVANALGKNVFSYKVQGMVIGSALAGLAGGVYALHLRAFSYSDFAPEVTFIVLLVVVLGGTANNAGVILGSALYWGFQRATQDVAGFFPAEYATQVAAVRRALVGLLFILVLYYAPKGVWRERKRTYAADGGGKE
jgi:neutral amino acid transport system permease protein